MRWTYLDDSEISAKDKMRQTLTGVIDDEESARSRSRTRAVMVAMVDRGWNSAATSSFRSPRPRLMPLSGS